MSHWLRALTLDIANTSPRVGREQAPRTEELGAHCNARVRALNEFMSVKQRPGRTSGAGVHTRRAYESGRGLHLADGTLLGVEKAPSGAPSGLRLRGEEPQRRLRIESGLQIAMMFRERPRPATRDRRAAARGAIEIALRALHGCSVDRKHFSLCEFRAARRIARGVAGATGI